MQQNNGWMGGAAPVYGAGGVRRLRAPADQRLHGWEGRKGWARAQRSLEGIHGREGGRGDDVPGMAHRGEGGKAKNGAGQAGGIGKGEAAGAGRCTEPERRATRLESYSVQHQGPRENSAGGTLREAVAIVSDRWFNDTS